MVPTIEDLTALFHNLQEAFDAESMSKPVLQPLLPCLQKLLILINQTPHVDVMLTYHL